MTRARITRRGTDKVGSTDFDTKEFSSEDSEPREYAEISHGTTVYRIAFGVRNLLVGNAIYTATAASRGPLTPAGVGNADREMTITLPIDHALVRRYTQNATPPKKISATVWRLQAQTGESIRLWDGLITSMACDDDGTEATFRIAPRAGTALLRVLPARRAAKKCSHVLYGAMCLVDRGTFTLTATVLHISGLTVRIDLSTVGAGDPHRADWLKYGDLRHVLSGERMTIKQQTDVSPGVSTITDLTLEARIAGLQVGHSVEVSAGCSREPEVCLEKFDNRQRFGGLPVMPSDNIFKVTGDGARGLT